MVGVGGMAYLGRFQHWPKVCSVLSSGLKPPLGQVTTILAISTLAGKQTDSRIMQGEELSGAGRSLKKKGLRTLPPSPPLAKKNYPKWLLLCNYYIYTHLG